MSIKKYFFYHFVVIKRGLFLLKKGNYALFFRLHID